MATVASSNSDTTAMSLAQRCQWVLEPVKKPPVLPHWTGSFGLLDFPRELRDRIYYHCVYRPEGIICRRNTSSSTLYYEPPKNIISLFLTCRQVYDEAYQVFCRHNIVELQTRDAQRHLSQLLIGSLRMFPDKPSRSLQRISIPSHWYMSMYHTRGDEPAPPPGIAFVQMLRDAYVIQSTFPRLREFIVYFSYSHNFFNAPSTMFEITGKDNHEKTQNAKTLMKRWIAGDSVAPPSWLVFHFNDSWHYEFMRKQDGIWNDAYQQLVREHAQKNEDIEESGKRWIEESSVFEKTKNRKQKELHPTAM